MDTTLVLQTEKLSIAGIRCAACIQLLEYSVQQQEGVESFRINPMTQKAELRWDQSRLDLKSIIQHIVQLGYAAFPAQQSLDEFQQKEKKRALWRLFIAGFAMMQVMMYAYPAYLVPEPSVDGDLTPDLDRLLKIASLVISLPVILFSAKPFFQSALRDLKHRHIGMDVPVSIGILFTFFASMWATFFGGVVYFDSAIMFVFLLLGARYIEELVKRRTTAALNALTVLPQQLVQRLPAYPKSREVEEIEPAQMQVGDVLMIAAGSQIPCDGIVIEGQSECDESLMTGESNLILKKENDTVVAGSVNQHSALLVRAQKLGQDTGFAQLIDMMESASMAKPRFVQIADRHASHFLIAIMIIAVVSGIVWSMIAPQRALWIAISVIVVTCPCALSLATPGVMSAAIGQLAKAGLLVTKSSAIEALANVTHVVFDKTGTLTHGRLRVVEQQCVIAAGANNSASESLSLALRVAALSMHPIAKAIHLHLVETLQRPAREAAGLIDIGSSREIAGAGLVAMIGEEEIRFGSPEFALALSEKEWQMPPHILGKSLSVLADKQGILAYFVLEDSLRPDAKTLVAELQEMGKKVLILSGDRQDVVEKCAEACGVESYYAQLQPQQKYQHIQHMQEQGAVVAMVGDGMNDGPALALADLSIAMGQGAPISQTRSDALLMSNRLTDVSYAIRIAKLSLRLIRENLAWAMLYNLLAIPAAVIGWLEPWHAALGMSMSSVLVVLNGLRVLRLSPPQVNMDLSP